MSPDPSDPDTGIIDLLRRSGLAKADEEVVMVPLTGGVSSDVVKIDLADGTVVCAKRALAKLAVEADWQVSVERSRAEAAWMRTAHEIVPDAVPRILAEDSVACMFVMEFFDPHAYPLWKDRLFAGDASPAFAAQVGSTLAKIHAGTAHNADLARRFANQETFEAIRIEPYLRYTALRHPAHAARLEELAARLTNIHSTLIHGDVSPKNILMGPKGPLFLDAECASYGDPAFDLAFCLTHFLLKSASRPENAAVTLACYDSCAAAYTDGVDWESPATCNQRVADLVPGLLLARLDGKSPVDYLDDEPVRARVRQFACANLAEPPKALTGLRDRWTKDLT